MNESQLHNYRIHLRARARARIHTHGSILVSWINNNNSSAIWFTHWCDHHLFIWFSCMSQKETIPIPNRFTIEYKFLHIISFCVLLVHYTAFSYTCLDYCVFCLVSLFLAYASVRFALDYIRLRTIYQNYVCIWDSCFEVLWNIPFIEKLDRSKQLLLS